MALGAAVQADILAGASKATEEMLLLDVTPLSLGIEALGGTVARIIQRNSTIPASATEHFTTGVDGQTNVAIHVVQGERELAADCRSLARFDLKGIPPMSAGLPRIEVRFLIDADGILQVSAREQRSGKAAQIEVKPTYGLTDEQVESMILDSFDHAEEDFAKRLLIEARNEAETILSAVERAPQSPAWQQLTGEEQAAIAAARDRLAAGQSRATDMTAIRDATLALDQATRRFAELMMDAAVIERHSRQDHERSRRGIGRRSHRASSHGAGGVQVTASAAGQRRGVLRSRYERRQHGKTIPAEKLVRVTFLPEGKTVEFEYGTMPYDHHGKPMSFLDVAENFDIFLDHACGGVCACTTCHLWIKDQAGHQRGRRRRARPAGHGRRPAVELAPRLPGRHHPPRRLRGGDSQVEPQLRLRGQAAGPGRAEVGHRALVRLEAAAQPSSQPENRKERPMPREILWTDAEEIGIQIAGEVS